MEKAIMDRLTKQQRSLCMSKIRSKHTGPEITVRKILRENGVKYRLHILGLPGKPDIIIPKKKRAIFVNGCFWHSHKNCKKAVMPKTNLRYWKPKLQKNIENQKSNIKKLRKLGWRPVVVWECQLKKGSLKNKLASL